MDLWHELTGKNGIHDLEKQMDIDNNLLLIMCVTKTLKEVLLYGENVPTWRIAIHILFFHVMNLVFLFAQLPTLLHLMLLFIPNISVFVVDFSFTLIKRVIHLKRSLNHIQSHQSYHKVLSPQSQSRLTSYLMDWRPRLSINTNVLQTLCNVEPELSAWLDNRINKQSKNNTTEKLQNLIGRKHFNQYFNLSNKRDQLNKDVQIDALYTEHLNEHLSKITLAELNTLKHTNEKYHNMIISGISVNNAKQIIQRDLCLFITDQQLSEIDVEIQQELHKLNANIDWHNLLSQKSNNSNKTLLKNQQLLTLLNNTVEQLLAIDKHNPSMKLLSDSHLKQWISSCNSYSLERLVFALRDYERHIINEIANRF